MIKKQSKATQQAGAQRAAERAAAIRKQQEAKERRRRTLTIGGVIAAVIAAIVIIGVAVQSSRDTTGQSATPPSGVSDTFGVPWGDAGAPVTVTVYEDFMCPFCGQFEAASRNMLQQYVDSGDARVEYRVLAFLDRFSNGTKYSSRAMNALGVVLDTSGPDVAKKFHDLLYENQPEENSDGLSDEQLVDLAVKAGADKSAVQDPIESGTFDQWVQNATDDASKKGVNSTPTVLVDGKKIETQTIEQLVADTEAAIKAGASS
jgi:protein-disulfide isomerase